eukprot:gene18606-21175_t
MDSGSYGYLRDFDWSVRMILSSDKLSGLGKPVVQLKLDTTSGSDAQVQENVVELDFNELTSLLKALKSAQAAAQVK